MATAKALAGLALFTLRRIFAGRRWSAGAVILACSPLLALVVSLRSRDAPVEVFDSIMIGIATYLPPLLLSLIYGIALTTSEIEDGTAGYVLLAALPRGVVALVEVLVTAAGLAALSAVSVAATYAVVRAAGAGPAPSVARAAWYAALAGAAILPLLASFVFCGFAFRRGIAVSVALAVLWEVVIVPMPVRFAPYTVTNSVRALVLHVVLGGADPGQHLAYNGNWDFPSPGAAAVFLAAVTAAAAALAALAASRRSLARGV
jgi:hypothetical protein